MPYGSDTKKLKGSMGKSLKKKTKTKKVGGAVAKKLSRSVNRKSY